MGVVVTSYMQRRGQRGHEKSKLYPPFSDALAVIEHCHQAFNAGGVQIGIGPWNSDECKPVRAKCEDYDMFLEGQIRLPENESDVDQFEATLKAAKEAGVTVHRVALGGRRYEDFDSLKKFTAARDRAWKRLRLAEPIAAKHRVKIGIENHKDWRIPDMLAFMEGLSSEYVGTCIDTGNSISLLEHPNETVEAFAKYGVTTHIKDMGVKEYKHGFLLSEVPIGEGFLDMKRLLTICEKAHPAIQFSVEMITLDPLKIPCLTEKYWATFGETKGQRLANALAMVRKHASNKPLPHISGRTPYTMLAYEEANIAQCIHYAETTLGLNG
ncbi:MAG: sugar phosphate isomerase/epimerase [Verrucomicrobiales bacterium]|jgi:sugar phosphate isomerase/epimerase